MSASYTQALSSFCSKSYLLSIMCGDFDLAGGRVCPSMSRRASVYRYGDGDGYIDMDVFVYLYQKIRRGSGCEPASNSRCRPGCACVLCVWGKKCAGSEKDKN
jgi:hypothetical protein